MRDKPDAADLLEIARTTLLAQLLPNLPDEQRYNALMVAAAMGIAAREAANGTQALESERQALIALFGDEDLSGKPLDETLELLTRRFAAALRAGEFDAPGDRQSKAFALLTASNLARLAECNPRYPKHG